MNLNEDTFAKKQTDVTANKKAEITSASIKNAHATGDGAVQKSDELLPKEDKPENTKDSNTY